MVSVVYFCIFSIFIFFAAQSYFRRSWIGLVLCFAFAIRALLALVFLTDLQLIFVLDGRGFEFEAWNLAKSWASDLPSNFVPLSRFGDLNFYKLLLAAVFYLFGREPLLGMLLNCFFACLNIFLIYRIVGKYFMTSRVLSEFDITEKSLAALILVFYPSYIIWSATNIRDPLYFLACTSFFYFFLGVFSKRSLWHFGQKLLGWLGLAVSFALILSIRFYIGALFLGAVFAGVGFYFLVVRLGLKNTLILAGFFLLVVGAVLQYGLQDLTSQGLEYLSDRRHSFANEGYEDFATSSFSLDYQFRTVWDLFLFVPLALSHYFFGPFFWNITSLLQGLSQIEVFAVYLFTVPTLIGIRKAVRFASFETTVIVVFCLAMAVSQAVTISNVGTLFRHRTLAFILLSMFTAVGLMEFRRFVMRLQVKSEKFRERLF